MKFIIRNYPQKCYGNVRIGFKDSLLTVMIFLQIDKEIFVQMICQFPIISDELNCKCTFDKQSQPTSDVVRYIWVELST